MKYLFLFALLLGGCSSKKETPPPPPIPVTTTHPVVKEASFAVTTIGVLLPNVQTKVFPKIEGNIERVCVQEGQFVEQGAPLFLIDATLSKIEVQKSHAQVGTCQAELNALQKKLERYLSLSKKDLISKTEIEELEAAVEKAKQSSLLAQLKVQEAETYLSWCTVLAPISGRVGKIDIAPGIYVNKETSLTSLTQVDPLIVECSLTEREFSLAKSSSTIIVSPLISPEIERRGTISFFDSTFDEKRGVLMVRGHIPNKDAASLMPGQVVVAHIPYRVEKKALLIPQKGISYNQEGPYVYTVKEGGTAEIAQLTLGEEFGDERMVLEGLTSESQVIVEGVARLFPGCSVAVEENVS
jgi:RND family efflux transporter MFP subunit